MDHETNRILLACLRRAICGDAVSRPPACPKGETLTALLELSRRHDVAHLVGHAFTVDRTAEADAFAEDVYRAMYRYGQNEYELSRIMRVLELAEIPHMPLKGAVLRGLYPKPWMRTSCDIDVLVHPADADRAVACLVESGHYTAGTTRSHDISLHSRAGNHIEIHYGLLEDGLVRRASDVLNTVWDTAILRPGSRYCYDMSDELFYFYHIAHMAKHIENGGCGLRPFIDLWILDGMKDADRTRRDDLLRAGELYTFAEAARRLSRVWFAEQAPDEITLHLWEFVLRGGVYGNTENRVAVQQQQKGGRAGYLKDRIFLPYDEIKFYYPRIQKHRWMTPFAEVHRWWRHLFDRRTRRTVRALTDPSSSVNAEAADTRIFLQQIGL